MKYEKELPGAFQKPKAMHLGLEPRHVESSHPNNSSFEVQKRLEKFCHHSSGFLAMNRSVNHYLCNNPAGLIPYARASSKDLVVHGGVYANPSDKSQAFALFNDHAHNNGLRISGLQLQAEDAKLFASNGYIVNQFGSSYSLNIENYDLRGRRFVKIRNMISRARREGVQIESYDQQPPWLEQELNDIDKEWLGTKGALKKDYRFMVGERGGEGNKFRRLYCARVDGQVIAYVTFSPVYGDQAGWLYDLTRRRIQAPPGTIELIIWEAIQRFQSEGVSWLHLGFTPFTGLEKGHEFTQAYSPMLSKIFKFANQHGRALYPALSQESFKLKWRPTNISPEYIALPKRFIKPMWSILRLTRAV